MAAAGDRGGGTNRKKGKGSKKKKGSASATPSIRDCANCGASEGSIPGSPTHSACARCMMTYYCSTKCQKEHWKTGGHKQHCVAVADRRVVAGESENGDGSSGGGAAAAEGDECAICLEVLSPSSSQTLPCSHVYHRACVEKLRSFGINQVCPMCRAELPPGPEKLCEEMIRRWYVLYQRYGHDERTHDAKAFREVASEPDRIECTEVLRMMREAADQGSARAQNVLAFCLMNGLGVAKNEATAVEWIRKAADQGYAAGLYALAEAYKYGKGVDQSNATAMKWYRKAADQGDTKAMNSLGCMHNEAANHAAAVKWTRKAAERGLGDAQNNIGKWYLEGTGVDQSDAMAVMWMRKAVDQNHMGGQCSLGVLYSEGRGGLRQCDATAVKYLKASADQGYAQAQHNLGFMYHHGKGVGQNHAKAAMWYRKAADQGQSAAIVNLATLTAQGLGVEGDIEEAAKLYRKAAAMGDEDAARFGKTLESAIEKDDALVILQEETRAAAYSSPSPSVPSPIPIGDRVVLRFLREKPELNAQLGVVVGFHAASGRLKVVLSDRRGPFSLKVENVMHFENFEAPVEA